MESTQDFATVFREHMEGIEHCKQDAAGFLRTLFFYLRSQHPELARIEVTYEGSGDSGQIEDVNYFQSPTDCVLIEIDDMAPLPDEVAQGKTFQAGQWEPERGFVKNGNPVNISARQLIDEFAWDLAYSQNPGFEINEGGYGTISITSDEDDRSTVHIRLSHSERIIETNDYEYDF